MPLAAGLSLPSSLRRSRTGKKGRVLTLERAFQESPIA